MERICYETLLYYGTIVMLHDRQFNSLLDSSLWSLFGTYFQNSPLPSDNKEQNWPILGVPYKLFRLIIAVSRLMHLDSLSIDDLAVSKMVYNELTKWIEGESVNTNEDPSIAKLYIFAAKALLGYILRDKKDLPLEINPGEDIRLCLYIISEMESRSPLGRFHLWPLHVLRYVPTNEVDTRIIQNKLENIAVY